MVRRFSWCTVVALVVLLFVTTEGLRERSTQVDDHKTHSGNDRGTLRYHFKSPEETTTSASSLSRTRSTNNRTSNLERHNGESVSKLSINSEAKVEQNRRSNFRTARTTERNGVSSATETTNNARRTVEYPNDAKKAELTTNRRSGKRYPSDNTKAAKSKVDEQVGPLEVPKEASRRMFNRKSDNSDVTVRLDNTGPSVFTATTEFSRSRTGRKIQTTYSTTDLKSQVPTSRKFNNRKFDGVETTTSAFRRTEGRGRSTTERTDRARSGRSKVNNRENNAINRRRDDHVPSESESVRVDVPLALEATESLVVDATTDNVRSQRQSPVDSDRESDAKDSSRANARTGSERSKLRGRSSHDFDPANSSSRNGSRRGSSKFNDYPTTETTEQTVGSRRNTVSRDRSRTSEPKNGSTNEARSRARGRNLENGGKSNSIAASERDVKRKSSGDRISPERRSRIADLGLKSPENRGQDQDTRGRSRSRSRVDATTPVASVATITTPTPDTTVSNDVTTISTESEVTSTTIRAATPATTTTSSRTLTTTAKPTTAATAASEGPGRNRGRGRGGGNQGRKQPKEDFFNHGLGFRGRRPLPEGPSYVGDSRKPTTSKNESQYHGNPGWTLRRRPGHINHSEIEDKIVPSPTDQTNEVIPSNEQSTSTEIITTAESFTATTRRGFKKQQSSTEESSTVAEATTKSFRRGNKAFDKNKTLGFSKGTAEPDENDNYPPEFKARLSQLKSTNAKAPAPKTTSRTPLEDQLQNIFGQRSRGNSEAFEPDDLETAASGNVYLTRQSLVMNPLTLINGPALRRVKKSSAVLFAERSRMKLDLARRLVKPELNIEENDLDATTASSFSKPKSAGASLVDETSKAAKSAKSAKSVKSVKPGATARRGPTEASQDVDGGSKLSRLGKSLEDSSKVLVRPSTLRKGRVVSERMVTSISVEETPEGTTKSYASTNPSVSTVSAEEGSATTIDSTRIRLSALRGGKKSREDAKLSRENNVSVTTFKPKKPYAYQSRDSKSQEQSTTVEQTSVTATPKKSHSATNKHNGIQRKSPASQEESVTKKPRFTEGVTTPTKVTFRPRYSKRTKAKSFDDKTESRASLTTKVPLATSRYSRKKSIIKSAEGKVKITTTEGPATQTKKQQFRPRTATYRRHSEVPTTLVETSTKVSSTGVAITPRLPRYHATLKSSTPPPRSVSQEPQVNLNIVNDTAQQTAGITGSSNGDIGNTNIFNPTRTVILSGNNTLLQQLRSTVAPLLSSLGNKTPIFSGAYSNVNNAQNSAPRITPNGSPPRFSARYKGAELFVRKPNNIYQPTVPSITSSSTTPVTPVESSGSAPPFDVSSPGEPRFLTFYHALESASIKNEQLQGNSNVQPQGQVGVVPKVDSNASVANSNVSNANNDTTSPTVATTSPQTPDTTTVQDSTQSPRLPKEMETSTPMVTTAAPENPSSTDQAFSTESPSTTEQVAVSTESTSTTEQASLSTESSSTTERTSTSADTMSMLEQTTTESDPENIDATVNPDNISNFSRIDDSSSDTAVPTTAPTGQNLTSSSTPSTTVTTDVSVMTTQALLSSTEGVTSSATSVSENPESSTVQMSEASSTQAADVSTTVATTTEAVSDNMIDVETTTEIPTSTVRSRLIDFAQDILSRLQSSLSTTTESPALTTTPPMYGTVLTTVPATVPGQDSTTTVSPVTEISNVISDSEMKNSLEVLAQLNEIGTTTSQGDLGATTLPSSTTDRPASTVAENMTTQSAVDLATTPSSTTDRPTSTVAENMTTQSAVDLATTPSSTTDRPASRVAEDITTQSAVDLVTTPSSTTDPSASRIAEDMSTQSAVGLVTTPSPTTVTDPSNDMVSTQEANTQDGMNLVVTTTPIPTIITTTQGSQTVSDTDSTTISMTTTTMSDTLLIELMSIAKTLLSEERNETEQLINSRVGNVMESEVDQQLDTNQAAESSSVSPDVTTETVESTSNTVAGSELTTTPVDPSQNEVDSVDRTTTGLPSDTPTTTARSSVTDSEVEVIQTNDTTTLGPLAEIVESTTLSATTETTPQVTLSSKISADSETTPDTTAQSQTTTPTSDTTVATSTVNFELTTNTYDLVSSNLITTTEGQPSPGQTTEVVTESTETVQLTNSTTVVSEPTMNTSTNQPEVTIASMDPESVFARVNIATTMPSTTSESNIEQTTVAPTTELVQNEPTMTTTASALLDANSMDVTEATTNQSPLTSSTELTMELTTNMPSETTNVPQTTPNLENETPTVVARFQDTSSTAQGTAGSGIGQTTEISTSMTTDSPITPSSISSTSSPPQSSITTTTSSSVETTTGTTTTTTTTETTISTTTPQTTTVSSRINVVTVTPMVETTVQMPVTTIDINENLVSTEASADTSATTTVSPDNMSIVSRIAMNDTSSIPTSTTAAATETATMSTQTTPRTTMSTTPRPPGSAAPQTTTPPYLGRFGGRRLTPAPRFSPSSTTRAPLRDYLIYGIYPNKTIVRKRPEDNLIDARNVNSPYVIFGIFPDGKLVRKFPNGTIIPDPPRSPVEVVFSLSTSTTTNRPPPRPYYNQVNQGTYNQYQGPVYDNNRRPVNEPMRTVPTPSTVDLGLTGNAIVGPNGGGPDLTGPLGTPAIVPSTNEMTNTPMNAQMGTTSNVMSAIAGRPPTDSQGSRIVQDRERDEATRTREAGGQRSSVYIGQDKFVNYWTNGAPNTNPSVLSVNINSVASAVNEGPSTSVPSFENLLNSQPGGQITAPPGFPWRDPLDQIFGITTSSPVITASVASNTLDDSGDTNNPVFARPVNPFVEVFTPFSSAISNLGANVASTTQSSTATATTTAAPLATTPTAATTAAPTTTTTTAAPISTTTTTMAPATTTTTTMAPTTTTTTTMAPTTTTTTTMAPATTTTTTMAPTTTAPKDTTTTTTTSAPVTAATSGIPVDSLNLPRNLLPNGQQQSAFGSTFDDLQFLNSLLQDTSRSSTPKTLSQVEQLLANKILSLALSNPGPTRAAKAINIKSASPNTIYQSSPKSLDPIVIDLSPSSTATAPTWQTAPSSSEKPVSTTTIKPVERTTPTSTTAKTTLISTTKAPIAATARTTVRPRTTTPPAPLGFAASLWQALFGNGLLAAPPTQRPVRPKQVKTTPKPVNITPKPASTTLKPETTTLRTVDVSKIQVSTPSSILKDVKSTTKQPLLNNPNPRLPKVATSTFSPEDDAKFLLALLRAAQEDNKAGGSKKSSSSTQNDESFLRAILSGRALATTTTPAPSNDISDAALLAALLKAQGIEPPTPATDIREQLLLASLGQSVHSAPNAVPAPESTTITTRPASSTTRPTVTAKKTATPRPTSGPRVRTTTWSPSSTYPPPLFSSFSNYGTPVQSAGGDNSGGGALFGATRAFSQFLGAAISGAAQQLQSLVRNGTRIVSGVVG